MDDNYVIRGVAMMFGRDSTHATPFQFRPASLRMFRPIALNLDHLRVGVPFASTMGSTLQVWTTDKAVIFEATLPVSRINAGLVKLVETGGFNRVSIGTADVEVETVNGQNLVSSAMLEEISITDAPSFKDTGVWVEGSQLHPAYHVRMAKVRYETAQLEIDRPVAAVIPSAKKPVNAAFVAQCRKIADMPKPAAWATRARAS